MPSSELLLHLPKTDLHVHLDGSLRLPTLIELARTRGVALPSETEEGLNALVFKPQYSSLEEYLTGFGLTCAVLQDAEALEQAAYELAWDNLHEHVYYVEPRFAPQLHMRPGFGYAEVLRAVNRGLERAQQEHNQSEAVRAGQLPGFHYGIIVCAMRMFTPEFSTWFARLFDTLSESPQEQLHAAAALELARASVRARDELGLPIVAFDLAGHEAGFPAMRYNDAFRYAHAHFLKKTVHAGEAYGPESIYQAISTLNADRIGHGFHLFSPELIRDAEVEDRDRYVSDLAEFIADRRVTLEVCITSNLQTNPSIGPAQNHTFRKMLDAGLSATLCTDNRLVSHTTVTRELELAVRTFKMTDKEIRNTLIYGFKRSFFPGTYLEKRAWVRSIINHYDAVLARYAPPAG